MHSLQKTLSLLVSVALLGQSTLFAQENRTGQEPSLAQYQQQLQEDAQRAPWISREGKIFLAAGGIAFALLYSQNWYYKRSIKRMQERHIHDNYQMFEQHTRENAAAFEREKQLHKELKGARSQIEKLNKEIELLNISANATRQQYQNDLNKNRSLTKKLQKEIQRQRNLLEKFPGYTSPLLRYTAGSPADYAKYEKLFDGAPMDASRQALRRQLAQEPWLLQAPKAQQEEFLKIIDEVISQSRHSRLAGDEAMARLLRRSIDKHMPIYKYLLGMGRYIFQSKNVMTVGLLLAFGVAAHNNASAQKIADRVNTNFDLFLKATPQELEMLEQNEEARRICIQGARLLHELSLLPAQDVQDLMGSFSLPENGKPSPSVYIPHMTK